MIYKQAIALRNELTSEGWNAWIKKEELYNCFNESIGTMYTVRADTDTEEKEFINADRSHTLNVCY